MDGQKKKTGKDRVDSNRRQDVGWRGRHEDMRKNDLQKRFKRRLKLRFKVQGKGDKDKDGK